MTKCHWSLASLFTQNTLYWANGGYRTCNICSEKVCFWYFQFSRKDYFVCSPLAYFFSESNGLCLAAMDIKYCEANCSRRGGFYVKWGFHLSCSFLLYCIIRRRTVYQRCGMWIRNYLLTDPDPRIRNPELWIRILEAEIQMDIFVAVEKKIYCQT